MNFLAHLTLSYFSADLQVGNFLGDFVKGREVLRLPAEVRRGVDFHRAIDRTTDHNAAVRHLNGLLKHKHGRYAGVITDIGFDYFLFLNWARFGPLPFPEFCQLTYRNLTAARSVMSPRVAGYVDNMTRDNWLIRYTTPAGMESVFGRVRPRLSRPELLDGVEETMVEFAEPFNQAFLLLFPRLEELANAYR